MPDFKIDPGTGDIKHNERKLPIPLTGTELNAQRIDQLILTIQGEWFWNSTRGLPYFTEILGKKNSKSVVDSVYYAAILQEPYIDSILEFNSTLDISTRTYSPVFVAKDTTGQTIGATL